MNVCPKRPFYKAGPVVRLEKIPADEFAAFIEARFTASGIRAEPGLGAAVVDLAPPVITNVMILLSFRSRGRRKFPPWI